MSLIFPPVTVLMPVYNGEKHIAAAIESVIGQTFTDFKLLVVDDCSTDSSMEIVRSFGDARIEILKNDKNMGLSAALNRGIEYCRSKYIARMDCDDICLPFRLEKQYEYMAARPEISVCGSYVEAFGGRGTSLWKYPLENDDIKCELIFNNTFAHPSVMFRREDFAARGLFYNAEFKRAQDYELWSRASRSLRMGNLDVVTLKYRVPASAGEGNLKKEQYADKVRLELLKAIAVEVTPRELELHKALAGWELTGDKIFVYGCLNWLLKLYHANRAAKIYPAKAFERKLSLLAYGVLNCGVEKSVIGPDGIEILQKRYGMLLGVMDRLKLKIKNFIKTFKKKER